MSPVVLLFAASLALGAEPGLDDAPGLPVPTDESAISSRSLELARGLRCPVCQGLSAADSQAESAIAMRDRAEELVRAGYSDDQVRDYFVDRYGEWVLLEPPRRGRHLLVWLAPVAALGLGALVVGSRLRSAGAVEDAPLVPEVEGDAYAQRILDELEDA